tara:strand:- start:1306 stop:3039 length:1734 start_codon:yes stop_codon:yes gene_type:complete
LPELRHIPPSEPAANAKYRRALLAEAKGDPKFQSCLKELCRNDVSFWISTFAMTYDPRLKCPMTPFALYDFQKMACQQIEESVNDGEDLCIAKSRDVGASWLCLAALLHRWVFRPDQAILLVSRNESYVDGRGNPKSLFWKLDAMLGHLPVWMLPRYDRKKLSLKNQDNGSIIDGESTTGDVARGDRRTVVLLDEFAAFAAGDDFRALSSTRDVTPSRIFLSTPCGASNAFATVAKNTSVRQVRLHWADHPIKGKDRRKDLKGRWRSPWYDKEVTRCSSPIEAAQELDIDFAGSTGAFFDHERLDMIAKKHVRPAMSKGELVFSPDCKDVEFDKTIRGRLHLWADCNKGGSLPRDRRYVIGLDIAAGTGASNSCMSIAESKTNEKVGEFASPDMRPDKLAKYAVALANWLRDENDRPALLIWESQGPGRIFADAVVELGHREIWYRTSENTIDRTPSRSMGWMPTRDSKQALLGRYRKSLFNEEFVNHSREAIDECREFIYDSTGGVQHALSISATDKSGAKSNHGDRVIADALACLALGGNRHIQVPKATVLPGSIAWRRKEDARRRLASRNIRWT